MPDEAPNIILCSVFDPTNCILLSQDFAVWEILATAVVSAVTVVASVMLANRTARNTAQAEIQRERIAERVQRRASLMITFADFCGSMIRRFREQGSGGPEDITIFSSRMNAYADEDEHDTLEWMKNVVSEIQAEGNRVIEEWMSSALTNGEKFAIRDEKFREAASAANAVFSKRNDELRGWVRTELAWKDYLALVDAEHLISWQEREEAASNKD